MVCQWEPGTQYTHGSVVEYEGHFYKIIQPHQSQADWTPSITPALWGRLPEESCHEYRSGGHHHQQTGGFVDQSSGYHQQPGGFGDQSSGVGYNQQEKPQFGGGYDQEDKPEGWMDEERKHQLKMGGGFLAGAALLGGGYLAYSKHKSKEEEEAKKQAWANEASQEKWLQSADATTQHYNSGGQSPPVFWTLVNRSDPIPNNAIEGGREGGHTLYIGRTYYKGGVHVGKASHHLGGCVIGYGGKEHNDFDKYEILCGDKHAIRWINHSPSHGVIQAQGWKPVEGGREEDGRFLFVCQTQHEGGVHPCKAQDGTDFAIFSYGGKEKTTQEFNILSYA